MLVDRTIGKAHQGSARDQDRELRNVDGHDGRNISGNGVGTGEEPHGNLMAAPQNPGEKPGTYRDGGHFLSQGKWNLNIFVL
jgi:hypothetical protein